MIEQNSMKIAGFLKPFAFISDTLEMRFKQGDMAALREIILIHQKGIYQLGLRLFYNKEAAADFAQDVFIRAYEKCEKYNPSRPLKPWLYEVATNLGRDRLRRKKEIVVDTEQISMDETSPKADEEVEKSELQLKVWNVLKKLNPIYREVLALRFSSDMSAKEIASVLGIGLSAVKVRLCRGMKAFEDAFKAQGGERYVV